MFRVRIVFIRIVRHPVVRIPLRFTDAFMQAFYDALAGTAPR